MTLNIYNFSTPLRKLRSFENSQNCEWAPITCHHVRTQGFVVFLTLRYYSRYRESTYYQVYGILRTLLDEEMQLQGVKSTMKNSVKLGFQLLSGYTFLYFVYCSLLDVNQRLSTWYEKNVARHHGNFFRYVIFNIDLHFGFLVLEPLEYAFVCIHRLKLP